MFISLEGTQNFSIVAPYIISKIFWLRQDAVWRYDSKEKQKVVECA